MFVAFVLGSAIVTHGRAAAAHLAEAFETNASAWTLSLVPTAALADTGSGTSSPPANEAGAADAHWTFHDGHAFATPVADHFTTATYTVPRGAAGFYAITDSSLRRDATQPGRIAVRAFVRRTGIPDSNQPAPAVVAHPEAGELFDFDAFLGYLDAGDTVSVAIGPDGDAGGDRTAVDFRIERTPFIPVSEFPGDRRGWSLLNDVPAGSPAARHLAWNDHTVDTGGFTVPGGNESEVIAGFRVPQSGYYALHDAHVSVRGAPVQARLYVGDDAHPRRLIDASPDTGPTSWDTDVGYVDQGRVIWLAFSSAKKATVSFSGTIIEWAPRRAPLRVRRGTDGWLDVFEPGAPRRAVDVPATHWTTVPAPAAADADATAVIREAITRARASQSDGNYVGIRLERGGTYTVASEQVGGAIFALRDAPRLIFDGNGATLRVASPELTRTDIELFTVNGGRDIVFHDLIVTATSIPFTTGEILDVSPRGADVQTVTFRVDPGALDPLGDISRDGRNNAYAYDSLIPGRLALGTWTHYPGDGAPSIRSTDKPGVFTHRVRRTGDSIEPGGKWLIKNKRAGVIYLTTRGGAENITLSAIDGRASGGGSLRFWQTSGVNILDCTFEPEGGNWISSSADGVHGRGREGVWIENTLIRGVCEDIMNTYGQNMAVVADDDPSDAVMTIRMFTRSLESFDDGTLRQPTGENVIVGDQLVFFNPSTGRVLGYAKVVSIDNGRFTLSEPVAGIVPWSEQSGRAITMVYNTRVAGRFFVRDSRLMDSMRFGIYIKARGGVVFNTQFEGLSGPSIFATNEPEWPEGPPATHLWVQGCTFSQNNYGYMPRHRDFMVVDPADISVYTRRFRDPAEPDDFRAHLTRGQFANSHMKFVGNVFHDWRGMGISVRNARNVRIEDNLFLPPVNDEVMRATLAEDAVLTHDGRGAYAAIHLDSVDGIRVSGNQSVGLPAGDRDLVRGDDVSGVTESENVVASVAGPPAVVALSFNEWFGATSTEADGVGSAVDTVALGDATHRPGRLGGGLHFSGGAPAVLAASADFVGTESNAFTVALLVQPEKPHEGTQHVWSHGDARQGVELGLEDGRWFARLVQDGQPTRLDLGPAVAGQWQHLALSFDGVQRTLRGFVDGLEVASTSVNVPAQFAAPAGAARFGGAFHGGFDEFRVYQTAIHRNELSALALRKVDDVR